MPRHQKPPELKLSTWKIEGKRYSMNPKLLKALITEYGIPDTEIQRRMGHGYHHLQELLDGKSVDVWQAAHVEYGIMEQPKTDMTPIPHSGYRPKKD